VASPGASRNSAFASRNCPLLSSKSVLRVVFILYVPRTMPVLCHHGCHHKSSRLPGGKPRRAIEDAGQFRGLERRARPGGAQAQRVLFPHF
jgi:hypothetical protein